MRRLIANLQQFEPGIDAGQIADILWLAKHMAINLPSSQADTSDQSATTELVNQEGEAQKSSVSEASGQSTTTQFNQTPSDTASVTTTETLSSSPSTQSSMGLTIRLAAAKSLRKPIELERAMRSLKRKVPSRSRQVLDEVATAEQIADTRMPMPVVRAEPQRWLDLALVVEETSLTEIWHKTINEFQWLLEHLGAFRDVRVWTMRRNQTGSLELFPRHCRFSAQPRSHNHKELKDPSRQRLILVLSDCTSVSWWEGKVHTWLEEWAKVNLVTVVQLMSQRLWNRGVLGEGLAVQLRTSVPGAPNPLWQVEGLPVWWTPERLKNLEVAVTLPVVTLEPAALGQWAQAVSSLGECATTGVLFKKDWQPSTVPPKPTQSQPEAEQSLEQQEQIAKQLVRQFRATASPLARRLAVLMAASPVDLRVVELIQETMVPDSRQVHVAEMYLSGLMMRQVDAAGKSRYEFKPRVRHELRKSLAQSEALLVLNKVSAYIAARLGREIQGFTALLLTDLPEAIQSDGEVLSFAEIALDVLRQMGEQYASLADEIVAQHRKAKSEPDVLTQQSFESKLRTVIDIPVPNWKQDILIKLKEWLQAFNQLEQATPNRSTTRIYTNAFDRVSASLNNSKFQVLFDKCCRSLQVHGQFPETRNILSDTDLNTVQKFLSRWLNTQINLAELQLVDPQINRSILRNSEDLQKRLHDLSEFVKFNRLQQLIRQAIIGLALVLLSQDLPADTAQLEIYGYALLSRAINAINWIEPENPCLMIVVRPSRQKKYYVTAYLSTNTHQHNNENIISLTSEAERRPIGLKEIPQFMAFFVEESHRVLLGKSHLATIEIFLPYQLFFGGLEQIQKPNFQEYSSPMLGAKYPIVIRSLERLDNPKLLNRLAQRFRVLRERGKDARNFLSTNVDALLNDPERIYANRNCLGIKINEPLPKSEVKRQQLYKILINSGIPIALWIRDNAPLRNYQKDLDRLLECPIDKLPGRVREERDYASLLENSREHIGFYLGLMIENPYRMPPSAPLRSLEHRSRNKD